MLHPQNWLLGSANGTPKKWRLLSMKSLFENDAQRAEIHVSAAGWTLDYAKNRANDKTFSYC
ncbi:hypothetical protein [Marinomonas shanghaiensis]|uniref:hypothetical protein n=1 Tax=Marinomonas shanghaiensis TaxID=2202418 RepID=UPI003A8EDFB9